MPFTICDNMVPFMFPYLKQSSRRQRTYKQTPDNAVTDIYTNSSQINGRGLNANKTVTNVTIIKATLVCLIDEQGLISAQGGKKSKINKRTGPNHYYTVLPNKSAQGGFFFSKKISAHVHLLGRPEQVHPKQTNKISLSQYSIVIVSTCITKMEHKNILNIFWPVLKILQFFGSCPIGKSGNAPSLSLIHISEPTRRTPISYAVFCLK